MDELDALLQTLEAQTRTAVRSPSTTLEPPTDGAVGRRALEVLRALTHDPRAMVDEGPLGEGGMGVVRLARQVALDRTVALKALRPEHRGERDVEALLSEAWRAGGLEHPNILPIHALYLDEAGLPVIVMKRIEGRTWLTLLRDPSAMEAHAPGRPPLDEHLRILQQVCNAVHFAHTRGVVHRDLKPENVMVGSFGEVYLVDWGLACAPGPSTQLAGTPAYMAPEMLGRGALSEATDVYLLGATLFHVLTGRAPHAGATPEALFSAVLTSRPTLPDGVPEALAALVRRCMEPEPSARPSSALAVRRELESFLERQGSLSLTHQSQQRLAQLAAQVSAEAPDTTRVYGLFAASRFGFEQALQGWPGNEAARVGWRAALRHMVTFEAAHGSVKTARAHLAELDLPDPGLEALLAQADARDAEQRAKLARLQQLETSLNPRTGASPRMWLALLIGVVWVVSPNLGGVLLSHFPHSEGLMTVPACLFTMALAGLFARRWKDSNQDTPLNQQLVRMVLAGMGLQVVVLLAGYALAGPWPPAIVGLQAGYWGVIATVGAAALLPSLWPTAAGYVVGAAGALLHPEHRYLWVTATNALFVANSLWIMKKLHRERSATRR